MRSEILPASVIPSVQRNPRRRRVFAFALVIIAATLWCASSAIATSGGYGPGITGPTGPANAPGGYSEIAATHTFSASGGTLGAKVAGGQAQLTVPKNAFGRTVQVEITTPTLTGIQGSLQQLGFGAYSAVGGIGVKAFNTNGKPFIGNFVHPLTLTIAGSAIGAGDRLVKFTSPSSATLEEAVFAHGSVTVTLLADPDFAILAPTAVAAPASASPTTAAGAAPSSSAPPTIVQGEQFTQPSSSDSPSGKIAIACLAVFVVAVGFLLARRRRLREASNPYGFVAATSSDRPFEPRHSARSSARGGLGAKGAKAKSAQAQNPLRALEPKHARR